MAALYTRPPSTEAHLLLRGTANTNGNDPNVPPALDPKTAHNHTLASGLSTYFCVRCQSVEHLKVPAPYPSAVPNPEVPITTTHQAHLYHISDKYKDFDISHEIREYESETAELLSLTLQTLDDISTYDRECFEAEMGRVPIIGCKKECGLCEQCVQRRRARPNVKDLAVIGTMCVELVDFVLQNFFHRLVTPQHAQFIERDCVTPLHQLVRQAPPFVEVQEAALKFFETNGSADVSLPLDEGAELPPGCPARLCFEPCRTTIDGVVDMMLTRMVGLHEVFSIQVHNTTGLTIRPDSHVPCQICSVYCAWLLPALVAPYFLRRQQRRLDFLAVVRISEQLNEKRYNMLINKPFNFPAFPMPPQPMAPIPELANTYRDFLKVLDTKKRKEEKNTAITCKPDICNPLLIPLRRPVFQTHPHPDPVEHPYSYFLSLSPKSRGIHLANKAASTRAAMGLPAIPLRKPNPWVCDWFTGPECGLNIAQLGLITDAGGNPIYQTLSETQQREVEELCMDWVDISKRQVYAKELTKMVAVEEIRRAKGINRRAERMPESDPKELAATKAALEKQMENLRRCRDQRDIERSRKQMLFERDTVEEEIQDLEARMRVCRGVRRGRLVGNRTHTQEPKGKKCGLKNCLGRH